MKLINKFSYIVILCLVALLIYIYFDIRSDCYHDHWIKINENILDTNIETDKNIFFVETKPTEFRALTSHQSCSIESAGNYKRLFSVPIVLIFLNPRSTHLSRQRCLRVVHK